MGIKQTIVDAIRKSPLDGALTIYRNWQFKRMANRDPRINANEVYRAVFHKDIDWDNPKNLIEKIYWLQLFTDTSKWTLCADKYRMREYVASKGCGHLLPKLYGHYRKASEIDFDELPDSFVLKTTNGCGQVLVVRDKKEIDIPKTVELLDSWLKIKYGYTDAQIHYSRIKPCIIAEENLSVHIHDNPGGALTDYKLWCFNGEPTFFLIVDDRVILGPNRGYSLSAFSLNWENISGQVFDLGNKHYSGKDIPPPACLDEMINTARILSEDFKEVRCDFYDIDGKLYIGEMTFTTGYGYFSQEFYEYLGSKIDFSDVKRIDGMNRPPRV